MFNKQQNPPYSGTNIKQAGAEQCQAQVKLEVIVEADMYLELKMKLATIILCDWVD